MTKVIRKNSRFLPSLLPWLHVQLLLQLLDAEWARTGALLPFIYFRKRRGGNDPAAAIRESSCAHAERWPIMVVFHRL